MTIKTAHPDYTEYAGDIEIMRDFIDIDSVKRKGQKYLPMTEGMKKRDKLGEAQYEAYKLRATVPDYTQAAVQSLVGMMHRKKANFALPAALEPMRTSATEEGESLHDVLRSINAEQLSSGRLCIVADLMAGRTTPVIRLFYAESVYNWAYKDGEYQFIVLKDSELEEADFEWETNDRYLLLSVKDGAFSVERYDEHGEFIEAVQPAVNSTRPLTKIPAVIINATDLAPQADKPPLKPLANVCHTIYIRDADYARTLHMQGEATLVTSGLISSVGEDGQTKQVEVGAGAHIQVEMGGSAKFEVPPADGIDAQEKSLTQLKAEARVMAGQLIDTSDQQQSGEAYKVRIAANSTKLIDIAEAGAAGLERLLKLCAEWMGANPDEVMVEPNTEFGSTNATPADVVGIANARNIGAPLSQRSVHDWLAKNNYTALSYEDEIEAMREESDV